MTQFAHILVPTDFEPASRKALELAMTIGQKFGSKLTLLHAFQLPTTPYLASEAFPIAEFQNYAQQALDREVAEAAKRYSPVASSLVFGYPSQHILDFITPNDVDLVVMGTHGRRGLSRALGSIAARVVRLSPVPVLTITAR